jgi:hypothetical protein
MRFITHSLRSKEILRSDFWLQLNKTARGAEARYSTIHKMSKRLFEKLFLIRLVGVDPPKSPLKRGTKIRSPLFKGG